MELSLFKRELIELAQRKRTYGLRSLVWFVFFVVFAFSYMDMTRYAGNMLQILGRGNQITEALFITLILTIYTLNPILACTAITSEKEKQTLGLLIVSKLSPTAIVLEKIASRMLPLLSLLLIAAPLFAVAYLFGGVTFSHTMIGLFILFSTILQVTTVAVFCSALFETGIAAFWATYIFLGVLYFTLPLMREFQMIRIDFGTLPDEEFLLFPVYQLAMLMRGSSGLKEVLLLTLPGLLITVALIVAARVAVIRYSFGSAFAFSKQLQAVRREVLLKARHWLSAKTSIELLDQKTSIRPQAPDLASEAFPRFDGGASGARVEPTPIRSTGKLLSTPLLQNCRPIAWRELRGKLVSSRWMQISCLTCLVIFELFWMAANNGRHSDEISAIVSIGLLIVGVLLVLGLSCRLFATERERQTLESLLVAPLTNSDLLRQKLAGVNRLILLLLIPVCVLGLVNIYACNIGMAYPKWATPRAAGVMFYRDRSRLEFGQFEWFQVAFSFLMCAVGCAFIYLHLAKWIAIYWGLKLNTQMKALLASVISVLALCLVPMLVCVAGMLYFDSRPGSFPPFYFTSPAIVVCLNEVHELHEVYRSHWVPNSEWFVIFTNFVIYGGLALCLRGVVLYRLPKLLNRPEPASHLDS